MQIRYEGYIMVLTRERYVRSMQGGGRGKKKRTRAGDGERDGRGGELEEEVGGEVSPCHAAQLDVVSGVARLR